MSRLPILAVLVTAGACACAAFEPSPGPAIEPNDPPQPAAEPPTASVPSVVDELYADIDGTVVAYDEAVELLEAGSTEVGESLLGDALAALDDLTARCQAIAGCDLSVPLKAYQEIANLQARVFLPSEEQPLAGAPDPVEAGPLEPPGRAPAQLNGRNLADLIELNRPVRNAINGWLTWNRPLLMRSYENYQYLRAEMAPAFEAAGMPEALLFGILAVESAGKVHAYSRVGAAGPLQFMRATGRRYGLASRDGFDQRLNPALAARASVAYLNDQFRELDNSLEKVLAAYNSGENRLKRLNRRLRGADFWSSEFYYALPRDTRDYVPKVLGAAWLYLHPEQYRLVWPSYATERVQLALPREMSLGELAVCAGNRDQTNGWFRTLRNLNPDVKPGDRIPAGVSIAAPAALAAAVERDCHDPELAALAAELHEASYADSQDLLPYVVQRGDTMGRIAQRHRCMSMREIAALNDIRPPRYLIRAGKTIKVPNC